MIVATSLSLAWTPWSLTVAVLITGAAAVLCALGWRRSGYRRSVGLLEALRLTVVVAMAVLLNQPEWTGHAESEGRPTVAVLWDASGSMETRDVAAPDADDAQPMSRREAIAPLINAHHWDTIDPRLDVVCQPFSSAGGGGTDLFTPLADALRQHDQLQAVVLISDGDWSDGAPPVQAASRLRSAGVPVLVVPVGSRTPLPDLQLTGFEPPTFGVAGKSVRIPLTIQSSLKMDHQTEVVLHGTDGSRQTHSVLVAANANTEDAIVWKPQSSGEVTLTLEVPVHPTETLSDNNHATATITIRREQLRVLVVESYPRWEYRYLRNALSRDEGIEVSCLLLHPGLSKVGGGSRDYLQRFPDGLDELAVFDVVFLGDVGVGEGQLTEQQCGWLKGLVEHQASGLVWMPGWQGRQFSLMQTALADLCPVVLDPAQPNGWGTRSPQQIELTQLGRQSLLTRLVDGQEENVHVWGGLPGFQWYAPVLRRKPGTQVLAVHEEVSNRFGRLPLIATQTYGAGKTLFMGTDGAWRWRKGVEDQYHYRFWGQVVRWMAYQRNMAEGESMRLSFSPEQPQVGQTISFRANVMDADGEPLDDTDVSARVKPPSGAAETIRFVSSDDGWGAYTARFAAVQPGKHAVTLVCAQTGATLQTSLLVRGSASERAGQPARPEVLEEIARVSGGSVLQISDVDDAVRRLAQLPPARRPMYRQPLWSHPAVAAALIALLAMFWALRKTVGLM